MKLDFIALVIFFIFSLKNPCVCQNRNLFVGVSIEPAFSVWNHRNLEDYSTIPNLNVFYGNEDINVHLSVGVVSKLGFLFMQEWTYVKVSYTVNSLSRGFVEHGPEMSIGFNYFFGEGAQFRFSAGVCLDLIIASPMDLKPVLRPFVVGLSFNLLN